MNQVPFYETLDRTAVAFDGDDTLWVDGTEEQAWERDFKHLSVDHLPCPAMADVFRARLNKYGFTIKSVRKALLESARETCGDKLPAEWLEQVEALPRLCAGLCIRPAAGLDAVESLARRGREIWIITKGDLVRQALKLARFGEVHLFGRIEIVSRKNNSTYAAILDQAGVGPRAFTMVGDSLAQDVLPVLRLGGSAVHVPSGISANLDFWSGSQAVSDFAHAET